MRNEVPTPFSNVNLPDRPPAPAGPPPSPPDGEFERPPEPFDIAPFLADVATVDLPRPSGHALSRPAHPDDNVDVPAVTAPAPDPTPALRLMPPIVEREPWWKRSLFVVLALAITAGYFVVIHSYWIAAPGNPGIDENAYLVGGRNIADHFSPGFAPPNDFAYVGLMWVQSPKNGWFYPKYGFGPSLLTAIGIWAGGARHGTEWGMLVSPVCAAAAVLAMFYLARAVAGSFLGVCAMILLGTGMTTLWSAIIPNSHAPSLAFVAWGMFLLLRWWQTGSAWRGLLAGLLLGYAVTIRYSEAMLLIPLYPLDLVLSDTAWWKAAAPHGGHLHWLVLLVKAIRFLPIGPLGWAVFLSLRWKRASSYVRAAMPLIGWAIPVAVIVAFNYVTLGVKSGYDLTNESKGFTTSEFLQKWPFAIEQLYMFGLFLTLPIGFVGMAMMFRRSWRAALLLTLWFVPGGLLYVAYYWGRQMPGLGYLRFFLTFFPAVVAAAMWLLYSAGQWATNAKTAETTPRRWRGSIAVPLSAGLLTAAAASIGLLITLDDLELQQRSNINLRWSAESIAARIASRPHAKGAVPVAFCGEGLMPQLLMFLQFADRADWYSADAFDLRLGGGLGFRGMWQPIDRKKMRDPTVDVKDLPVLVQTERVEHMTQVTKGKTAADLVKLQHDVVFGALDQARPVFAVLTPIQLKDWQKRFVTDGLESETLEHWTEPCALKEDEGEPNPLAPRRWKDMFHRGPEELYLIEVRRKPTATQPATSPATTTAAARAS